MSKMIVLLFVAGFWLVLPLPFMIFNISGNDILNKDSALVEAPQETGIFAGINTFFKGLSFYFKVIFMGIDGVPDFINYFLWFLRIASLLAIILVIKE